MCWFLDQQPSCNYVKGFWLRNQSYQISTHHYVLFVGAWMWMEVFKPWTNECYWDYLFIILVITKFWIHICKPSNHDQTTLLYIQESWYSWQLGFGLTFKANFGFTNIFLKLTMKNQVVKAMVEHTNENSMIKLWHQLATNNMLIVCLFELMRLVNLAIV